MILASLVTNIAYTRGWALATVFETFLWLLLIPFVALLIRKKRIAIRLRNYLWVLVAVIPSVLVIMLASPMHFARDISVVPPESFDLAQFLAVVCAAIAAIGLLVHLSVPQQMKAGSNRQLAVVIALSLLLPGLFFLARPVMAWIGRHPATEYLERTLRSRS